MIIRKLFKFENAHVVRNCSSDRCKYSIHGHSYKVEVLLTAKGLDNGHMVYDFGLLKGPLRDYIDSFDHAVTVWDRDSDDYVSQMKAHSARWISLPVSPSAEQFSRVFFVLASMVLNRTEKRNGEFSPQVHSVIVHETDTGYAQCFAEDVEHFNPLEAIVFSDAVRADWADPDMHYKLVTGCTFWFCNEKPQQQVLG